MKMRQWEQIGYELIGDGKLAVLLLAGGQVRFFSSVVVLFLFAPRLFPFHVIHSLLTFLPLAGHKIGRP